MVHSGPFDIATLWSARGGCSGDGALGHSAYTVRLQSYPASIGRNSQGDKPRCKAPERHLCSHPPVNCAMNRVVLLPLLTGGEEAVWNLDFGASLGFGAWDFVLTSGVRSHRLAFN
jgi:hypothetical protein